MGEMLTLLLSVQEFSSGERLAAWISKNRILSGGPPHRLWWRLLKKSAPRMLWQVRPVWGSRPGFEEKDAEWVRRWALSFELEDKGRSNRMIRPCGKCETESTHGYCSEPVRNYPRTYAELNPCSDYNCILRKPKGMATQGGCRCLKDLNWAGAADYPNGSLSEAVQMIRVMRDEIERLQVELKKKDGY